MRVLFGSFGVKQTLNVSPCPNSTFTNYLWFAHITLALDVRVQAAVPFGNSDSAKMKMCKNLEKFLFQRGSRRTMTDRHFYLLSTKSDLKTARGTAALRVE